MDFRSKSTHESKAVPGLRFTIRHLTKHQRDKRDLPIAKQQAQLYEITAELARLEAPYKLPPVPKNWKPLLEITASKIGETWTEEDQDAFMAEYDRQREAERIQGSIPEDVVQRMNALNIEQTYLVGSEIVPATIRAGLISVEEKTETGWKPLEIDGKKASVDSIIELFPDSHELDQEGRVKQGFIEEIRDVMLLFMTLSREDAENFLLPSPSPGAAAGITPLTTATPAVTSADITMTATAQSTSQTT